MGERKTDGKDESLNEEGSLVPLLPVRGDGETGQFLSLGTCFQLWLWNSSFSPFSLLAAMWPMLQHSEQEGLWGVTAGLLSLPPPALCPCLQLIAANTASRDGAGGECWTLSASGLLLPEPCNPACLQMFSRCVYRGEIFRCLSIPQKYLVLFFLSFFWKVVVPLLISLLYFIVGVCECITSSRFEMDFNCVPLH